MEFAGIKKKKSITYVPTLLTGNMGQDFPVQLALWVLDTANSHGRGDLGPQRMRSRHINPIGIRTQNPVLCLGLGHIASCSVSVLWTVGGRVSC